MDDALKSSKNTEWRTPLWLFNALNARHQFTLDAAATKENALCEDFRSAEPMERSALDGYWTGRVFCNPPYKRNLTEEFIRMGVKSVYLGHADVVVFLVHARTDTHWFRCLLPYRDTAFDCHFEFIRGRIKFLLPDGSKGVGSPFPTVIATVTQRIEGGR